MSKRATLYPDGNVMFYNKKIGSLKKGVYRKVAETEDHLFRKYNSYGFDAYLFKKHKEAIKEIRVLDRPSQTIYSISAEKFFENGYTETINSKVGEQHFCNLKHWDSKDV